MCTYNAISSYTNRLPLTVNELCDDCYNDDIDIESECLITCHNGIDIESK